MRNSFLSFSVPLIGEEEIEEVVATLRSSWITTGPKTKQFEAEFGRSIGARGALALNSCTAALHTALATMGVGKGDEVITTPMTFAASVNVIEHVGARPVLVDVEADTLNIDPMAVADAVTSRTRAVLPVHFAGHPAEMDPIQHLAEVNGLMVVEDAAHALPSKYRGRTIGSGGNPTAFSFYATKNLVTAEGGMLTGEPGFLERARIWSLHGMSSDAWKRYHAGGKWFYEVVVPGYKYNMTDIQSSIGLWQLRKLEAFQQRRREIVGNYSRAFEGIEPLQVPSQRAHVDHAWHLYVLRLRIDRLRIGRDEFIEVLARKNIGTSVHFIPVHMHPYYRDKYGYTPSHFPVAYDGYARSLSLPLCPSLSDKDVNDVIEAVLETVEEYLA
ncbi:MAG TPA: DegT/DnrJ/EryC1/StrS family aminotransferase [Longimicrobiales bacterium]|nr:DegT/DnrJ/EryC1/StrS family aminotransferase [Longimicrobiales bacterium]